MLLQKQEEGRMIPDNAGKFWHCPVHLERKVMSTKEKRTLLFGCPEWNQFKSYALEHSLTLQEAMEKTIRQFLEDRDSFEAFLVENEDRLDATARRSVLVSGDLYKRYVEAADSMGEGRNRLTLIPLLIEWFLVQEMRKGVEEMT